MKMIIFWGQIALILGLGWLNRATAGEVNCGSIILNHDFNTISTTPCQPVNFGVDGEFVCSPPFAKSGQSAIGENANDYNRNFVTTGGRNGGAYLFGDPLPGTWRVWYQTVNLVAGARYEFGFYARNVDNVPGHTGPTLEGHLGSISGLLINRIANVSVDAGWVYTSGQFTATASGKTEISIVVANASFIGYDYGIDDIYLLLVDAPVTKISSDTTICAGNKAVVSVGITPAISGATYEWRPASAVANPTSSTTEFIGDSSITLLAITYIGSGFCVTSDSVRITVTHEKGEIVATATTFCEGKPVILSVNGSQAEWSTGETTPTIQADKPGTYSVRYRMPSGCIATASQIIGSKASIGIGYEKRFVTTAGRMVCDTIALVNSTPDTLFLDPQKLHLARNIMFSLPQHQLPAAIPPNDSIVATVCFHPTISGKHSDTLSLELFGYCSRDYIMIGQADEYEYGGKEHCRVVVKGFPLWDNITLYPQPARMLLNMKINGDAGEYNCKLLTPAGVEALSFSASAGENRAVDVSGLAAGVYYLEIQGKTATGITPVTITR